MADRHLTGAIAYVPVVRKRSVKVVWCLKVVLANGFLLVKNPGFGGTGAVWDCLNTTASPRQPVKKVPQEKGKNKQCHACPAVAIEGKNVCRDFLRVIANEGASTSSQNTTVELTDIIAKAGIKEVTQKSISSYTNK
ncbi:Hypothetical predicted protein [Pelobates cultripes]|uniref:Uncharacterized protein n=1 Tax=Pelobates cultripes TaxID=61616 RepID=A0AAD1VU60_PELCU|nr:Hypothetical predicted protein [Pelobates cultripes]